MQRRDAVGQHSAKHSAMRAVHHQWSNASEIMGEEKIYEEKKQMSWLQLTPHVNKEMGNQK